MARPSVFPTGVTIYDPARAWNGFTLFPCGQGAALVDMNGRLVHLWCGVHAMPVKPLPGGQILGSVGQLPGRPGSTSSIETLQLDWEGNPVWRFHAAQQARQSDGTLVWASMQHHDFEREGSPTGYYAPGQEPLTDRGSTLLLTHHVCCVPEISQEELLDERILEVAWDGSILWQWDASAHFAALQLGEADRKHAAQGGDWLHLNALSVLGPNRFYDAGDARFAPENLLCSSQTYNLFFIIEKASGEIVWQIGPEQHAPDRERLGAIYGQHHVHMIPKGLPGAGNILLFDNGSTGSNEELARRHYSRVLEFDPVRLEPVWEYSLAAGGLTLGAHHFFSPYISAAQRLPNGNTLVTLGADGILQELTPDGALVWELVNPLPGSSGPKELAYSIYRAYRLPYQWAPQAPVPEEVAVVPPENAAFRVPGSFGLGDVQAQSVPLPKL